MQAGQGRNREYAKSQTRRSTSVSRVRKPFINHEGTRIDTNSSKNHGVETRSFPNSLAATLATLPSISLIPSARLHGYHGQAGAPKAFGDFSPITNDRSLTTSQYGIRAIRIIRGFLFLPLLVSIRVYSWLTPEKIVRILLDAGG